MEPEVEATFGRMIRDYKNLVSMYENIYHNFQTNFFTDFSNFGSIKESVNYVQTTLNDLIAAIRKENEVCFMNASLTVDLVKNTMLACAEHSFRDIQQSASTYATTVPALSAFLNQKFVFSSDDSGQINELVNQLKESVKSFSAFVHDKKVRDYTTRRDGARWQIKNAISQLSSSMPSGFVMSRSMDGLSLKDILTYVKNYIDAIKNLAQGFQYQIRYSGGEKSDGFFATIGEEVYNASVKLLHFLVYDILSLGGSRLNDDDTRMKLISEKNIQLNDLLSKLTNSFSAIKIKSSSQVGEDWLSSGSRFLPLYMMAIPIKIDDSSFDALKSLVDGWYKELNKIGTGKTERFSAAAKDNIINFLKYVAGLSPVDHDSDKLVAGYYEAKKAILNALNLDQNVISKVDDSTLSGRLLKMRG